jgi:RNA recognition motif-containing protein
MSTKLYVGGLAWATTDQSLQEAFAKFGNVVSAKVMTERDSGRSRGFGFVEFASAEEAQAAIAGLNGTELDGRQISVNEARPMTERKPGGFGGGNRGGNGGGNRW